MTPTVWLPSVLDKKLSMAHYANNTDIRDSADIVLNLYTKLDGYQTWLLDQQRHEKAGSVGDSSEEGDTRTDKEVDMLNNVWQRFKFAEGETSTYRLRKRKSEDALSQASKFQKR